jgi:anhydro-N-acetylmuramic acid kinase
MTSPDNARHEDRRLVIGCMSGTSIDGIDAALVEVRGRGLAMSGSFRAGHSAELGELGPKLRSIAEQTATTAAAISEVMRAFSLAHASVVRELLAGAGVEARDIECVCVHGQTAFHKPPTSWQLFNPWPMGEALGGVPIVYDLRGADLAAGGQGAPITPLADWVLFRDPRMSVSIVNLGGFCNVTRLPAGCTSEHVEASDVCACNLLLDEVARRVLRAPYDAGGQAALAGEPHADAVEDLEGILAAQSGSRRSLGTGDEVFEWLSRWRAHVSVNDLAASACEGIGQVIARALAPDGRALLAGGGVHNRALVAAIGGWASISVEPLDTASVPGAYREAAEFAVLGALCQDGVAITLPAVTGVRNPAPISGCWAGLRSVPRRNL